MTILFFVFFDADVEGILTKPELMSHDIMKTQKAGS
jgi:hypothetical protein